MLLIRLTIPWQLSDKEPTFFVFCKYTAHTFTVYASVLVQMFKCLKAGAVAHGRLQASNVLQLPLTQRLVTSRQGLCLVIFALLVLARY